MKRPIISTLTILLLALIFPVSAQQNGDGARFSQSPYQIGERLTYNVSFSNFPSAAHAEFQIVSRGVFFGRDAIQLRAHVETTGLVNVALLAINNDYTTYIDPETGLPFRSEETARDATRSADSVHDFNQTAGNEAIPPKQRGFPGTYDLLSAFYRARALPLSDGGEYSFVVRGEGAEYHAELKVTGRQATMTNVGSFNTIVTRVSVDNSPVRNLRIYFSDDERHVPVLITGRVGPSHFEAELAASEIVKPPAPEAPAPDKTVKPAPMPPPTSSAPPPTPTVHENWPFTVGEQLNYQIFIGSDATPMATATFQVRGRSRYFERDGYFLTVNAQTTNALARLFVARDQIDSYVEPQALLPFRTVMNLMEGQRRLNQTLTVNQDTGTVTTDQGTKIEIPVGTHDYVSFFYAIRTFNLTPNRRSAVAVLVENRPKTIFVQSQKRETIQLGQNSVPAIAVTITTDDPVPDKYQLRMWISDDRRRLPLRIAFTTQLGALRADLAILPAASH
ncbi:MAG TPA: DUF3108 domain-containing protein [Pyrinomonadaceae bacterium]|nr:DUF3108 domain-containing protein [Pyrinomonadaceae bacterium]